MGEEQKERAECRNPELKQRFIPQRFLSMGKTRKAAGYAEDKFHIVIVLLGATSEDHSIDSFLLLV